MDILFLLFFLFSFFLLFYKFFFFIDSRTWPFERRQGVRVLHGFSQVRSGGGILQQRELNGRESALENFQYSMIKRDIDWKNW